MTAGDIGAATSGHTHTGSTISALDAGDTTSGTFSSSRIPTHTGEVTGGTSLSLANSCISGQGSLTSGLSGSDELLISDAGTIKRMDVSVMNSYFNSNLSFATTGHTHTGSTISNLATGDTTSGTFVNARISSGSVTQHLAKYANWTTSGQNDAQMTVSTSAANSGANGDIHFRY